jgi:hypothetical protein
MGDIEKWLENGTWETPIDLRSQRQFIHVDGMTIPVLFGIRSSGLFEVGATGTSRDATRGCFTRDAGRAAVISQNWRDRT